MDPSTYGFPALHTRGWDLPEEILHAIMSDIELRKEDEFSKRDARARAKHPLVAPSLVNKYWSAAIRPLLFRTLNLRSLEDALFLQDVVRNPEFAASVLATAITQIHIWYTTPLAKHWVYHVHWLMSHLPQTEFAWDPEHNPGDSTLALMQMSPFAFIPSVPSSFQRLTVLRLEGLRFASCAKLVKLIDSFHTLTVCNCYNLSFIDPSPYVPPPWRQRQAAIRRPLWRCRLSASASMALATQAALASDILRVPVRLGLDDGMWTAVLNATVALVPDTWEQVTLKLRNQNGDHFGLAVIAFSETTRTGTDVAEIQMDICHLGIGSWRAEQPLSGYVRKFMINVPLLGMHTTGATSLDVLYSENHEAVSNMEEVLIWARSSNKDELSGMKKILCAVMHRTQLTWALDSHRLFFGQTIDSGETHLVTSEDILSMHAEHTIEDTHITLSVPEQAEWLLLLAPEARVAYLRQLPAQRAEALARSRTMTPAGADIPVGEATADGEQGGGKIGME